MSVCAYIWVHADRPPRRRTPQWSGRRRDKGELGTELIHPPTNTRTKTHPSQKRQQWEMSRYSNCLACLTIMLVYASSSQPTYRSIETFLRGTRKALLLQPCPSCIHIHISVKLPCLRSSAIYSLHHQNVPQQCYSLPLATFITTETKWCTVVITIILWKLLSNTGSPPKLFFFELHTQLWNIQSKDLSLSLHYFAGVSPSQRFHWLFNHVILYWLCLQPLSWNLWILVDNEES